MGIFNAKQEIGPDTVLQRRNDLLFNLIDGEIVMLSVKNGEYYGMDKIGSYIWQLLEQPYSLNNLVHQLTEHFEVSNEKCLLDTLTFINKLNERELITLL